MRHVEEFALPITVNRPNLPSLAVIEEHVRVFFQRIWPIFPVVDHEALMTDIHRFLSLQTTPLSGKGTDNLLAYVIQPSDVPALVSIYLIISIAADEAAGSITETSTIFLDAAYSFYGHLVALPYIGSVQALLLIVIALRGRGKEGQGWHVLGQAIRTAHSIGLHRHISTHDTRPRRGTEPGYKADLQLHGRLWWTCYSLEKLMEMETVTRHTSRQTTSGSGSPVPDPGPDKRAHLPETPDIVLRPLQRDGEAGQGTDGLGRVAPESLRPGQETSVLDHHRAQPHLAAFLSIHYHQAQITLFRASLIFPAASYADEVQLYPHSLSAATRARLLQSQNLAIAAGRALVRQVLDLADARVDSQVFTITQPFLAAVVLALHVLRHPRRRMARADCELLSEATRYCEDQYRRLRQDPAFIRGCAILRERVQAVCREAGRDREVHSVTTTDTTTSEPGLDGGSVFRDGSRNGVSAALASDLSVPTTTAAAAAVAAAAAAAATMGAQSDSGALFDPFAGLPLDELWPMLGTEFLIDDNERFIQME
ncbi:hypothetical protein PG994_002670 [Apiospora phragmitis]|uniref:Xylanolytic transcriptional activator regulatory domain-containing protein n=1 Tax=Apiospora phragmitis TaxID=2905665 RepID=A0ABR1W5X7_9PEZI